MTNSSPQATKDHYTSDAAISPWRMGLLATACGLLAANVYYSQPIAGSIAVSLGLAPAKTGLIVALTQAGFGAGLLLIVPLGDLIEKPSPRPDPYWSLRRRSPGLRPIDEPAAIPCLSAACRPWIGRCADTRTLRGPNCSRGN